jgi:type II secretory pathway pseudopilin PulG
MPNGKRHWQSQRGFTFIGLLILIMIAGFTLAEAGNTWRNMVKREKEQELLKIGDKFREAIGNYYNQSPGNVKQYPPSLQALLRDDRFLKPRRYLREIYVDPMTGMRNWGTYEAPTGGIMAVTSLSLEKPFKTANFKAIYKSFEKKDAYVDWVFAYTPEGEAMSSVSLDQ